MGCFKNVFPATNARPPYQAVGIDMSQNESSVLICCSHAIYRVCCYSEALATVVATPKMLAHVQPLLFSFSCTVAASF